MDEPIENLIRVGAGGNPGILRNGNHAGKDRLIT